MKPCEDKNSNVCVAEGCYGEACVSQEDDLTDLIIEQLKKEKETVREIMEKRKKEGESDAGSGRSSG